MHTPQNDTGFVLTKTVRGDVSGNEQILRVNKRINWQLVWCLCHWSAQLQRVWDPMHGQRCAHIVQRQKTTVCLRFWNVSSHPAHRRDNERSSMSGWWDFVIRGGRNSNKGNLRQNRNYDLHFGCASGRICSTTNFCHSYNQNILHHYIAQMLQDMQHCPSLIPVPKQSNFIIKLYRFSSYANR